MRLSQRNGTRDKTVSRTNGDLTVKIPKLRTGSFVPTLLAPRRRIDVALQRGDHGGLRVRGVHQEVQ